jgi:hypothetical protein
MIKILHRRKSKKKCDQHSEEKSANKNRTSTGKNAIIIIQKLKTKVLKSKCYKSDITKETISRH